MSPTTQLLIPRQSVSPENIETEVENERIHLLYACGAMTVHLVEASEVHAFTSGAVGVTDAEVVLHGRVADGMLQLPAERALVQGNVLLVPGTGLMALHQEIAQERRREGIQGMPSINDAPELALARLLRDEPLAGVAYGGLIRYWHDSAQYASASNAKLTLMTFSS